MSIIDIQAKIDEAVRFEIRTAYAFGMQEGINSGMRPPWNQEMLTEVGVRSDVYASKIEEDRA